MQEIIQRLETKKLHLYLLINNIDGMNFRNSSVQQVFQLAANCSCIHILATMDHIHGPLIWNEQGVNTFRWLWYTIHTWLPYVDETLNERLKTARSQTGQLAINAIEHIIESLTPNARKIFRIIVESYVNNINTKDYNGIKFSELYDRCKRLFYVNNEQNLRLQLVEFIDHNLIKLRKNSSSDEIVALYVKEEDVLQQILIKLN